MPGGRFIDHLFFNFQGGRTLGGVGDGFVAPCIIFGCRMLHLPGRVYNDRGCGQLDLRLTSPGSHQDATPPLKRVQLQEVSQVADCMFFFGI